MNKHVYTFHVPPGHATVAQDKNERKNIPALVYRPRNTFRNTIRAVVSIFSAREGVLAVLCLVHQYQK